MNLPLRIARKHALAAALAAVALVVGGCGGGPAVDTQAAEDLVSHGIESHSHLRVKAVSCPSGVDLKAGQVFECYAKTSKRGRFVLTLVETNARGGLRVVDLKPTTKGLVP